MKKLFSALVGTSVLALVLATPAIATPITGSISFDGTDHFNNLPIGAANASARYDFGGHEIRRARGHDDIVAKWHHSAGHRGQSFHFGSAASATVASVPDTGMTITLLALGLGLIGLKARSQRLSGSIG